jgi:hypothetical protein
MAKKTKAASRKTLPRSRAIARAESRVQCWLDRLDYLDEWITRGASCDPYRMPHRRDLCEAEYQRRLKQHGKEGAPTLEHFARHGWECDERLSLEGDLRHAARRTMLLDGYKPSDRAPLDELQRRCFGRSDLPSPEEWQDKSDPEVLCAVVAAFRRILDAEPLARAVAAGSRKPSPLEAAILDVLLEADRSLASEEIAARVARGKSRISKPPRAILAAIGKIRGELGLPGLKAQHGVGFKLKPEEVEIVRRLLTRR